MFEGSIQRVEERHPVHEKRLVVRVRELETLDDGANSGGFRCAKPAVLQIEIVNDGRKAQDCRLVNLEDGAQCLVRATLPLMTELHTEHVERDRVGRNGVSIDREAELCLTVDESTYEPR